MYSRCIVFLVLVQCISFSLAITTFVARVGTSSAANYSTINSAYTAIPTNANWTIQVESGSYDEQLIFTKPNGVLIGITGTVIVKFAGLRDAKDNATISIDAVNVKVYNITFINIMPEIAGDAIVLIVDSANVSFYNCKVMGFQDALWFRNGRSIGYFKNCYIEGGEDMIYGGGLGYFDNCTIATNKFGASVTAMQGSGAQYNDKYIFNFCTMYATLPNVLIAPYADNASFTDPAQFTFSNFLGRPWDNFSRIVFMFSYMSYHINPTGWQPWSGRVGYYYREYNNTGPGGSFGVQRINFANLMTPDEAANNTFDAFLGPGIPYWVDAFYPPTICPDAGSVCGGSGYTGLPCCRPPYTCVNNASFYAPTCVYVPNYPRQTGLSQAYNTSVGSINAVTITNPFGKVISYRNTSANTITIYESFTNAVPNSISLNVVSYSPLSINVAYSPLSDPRNVAIDIYVVLPKGIPVDGISSASSLFISSFLVFIALINLL